MRIAITGANGFLGRQVLLELRLSGHRPVALVRRSAALSPTLAAASECRDVDIVSGEGLDSALEGVDAIVHTAGLAHQFGRTPDPDEYHQVNTLGTQHVVEAAVRQRVRRIVLVSSVSVYGGGEQCPDESHPLRPVGPYAQTKARAELVGLHLGFDAGIPTTALRFPAIYGAGDPGNLARLMRAIAAGRFVWVGQGSNAKSLIHVRDAARACVLASTRPSVRSSQVYNVVGSTASMDTIVRLCAESLGRRPPSLRVPATPTIAALKCAATLGISRCNRVQQTLLKWLSDDSFNGARFERDYEFQAKVSLEEGILDEATWVLGQRQRPLARAA